MKRNPYKTAMGFYCLIVIMILCTGEIFAQSETFLWPGDDMENMNWKDENENEFRLIMEEQDELKSHPVNLNSATEEELERIPFLNTFQRKHLSEYLKEYGDVLSMYELLVVQGFDSVLIRKIMPYIAFPEVSHFTPMSFGNLFKYGKNQLMIQAGTSFPRSEGYRIPSIPGKDGVINYYPGNPYRISFRYTYSFADRLAIGFSGDKDPGEQFFAGAQKSGMDYYSGYISFSTTKTLKRLIIGNYRAGWGLGLTFNMGSSLGVYPGFSTDFSTSGGIRPTQSVTQSSVLRGIALCLGAGRFTISGICSYRMRDANTIEADSVTGRTSVFSSFTETGYHRTSLEIRKSGNVSELIFGGNLNYRGNFFSVGATAYSVSLSASFEPRPGLYNYFAFRGSNNFVMGADFNLFYRFLRITGEVTRSRNGSVALIAALNVNPDPRVSAVLLYRNYPMEFQNLYSKCFRQNSNTSNEKAWFLSLSASLPLHLNLSIFADFCTFPWAKYNLNTPSSGNDLGIQLTCQLSKYLNLLARFNVTTAETNSAKVNEVNHATGSESSEDLRLQLNWDVASQISLQSRIEFKTSHQSSLQESNGWLLFESFSWKPLRIPVTMIFRYAAFDCSSYNSRIWAYEPDVLYGYSMPAYYGQGIRTCALFKIAAGRHFVFSLKTGLTRYNDKTVISSGLDQIDANWKLDLTGQCQIRI